MEFIVECRRGNVIFFRQGNEALYCKLVFIKRIFQSQVQVAIIYKHFHNRLSGKDALIRCSLIWNIMLASKKGSK